MNKDRLGKLLEAWRLADENAGADHGEERAKREGEIRALIGGGEAAPDPWPDAVRKASEARTWSRRGGCWWMPSPCPWCAVPANGAMNRTPTP